MSARPPRDRQSDGSRGLQADAGGEQEPAAQGADDGTHLRALRGRARNGGGRPGRGRKREEREGGGGARPPGKHGIRRGGKEKRKDDGKYTRVVEGMRPRRRAT